jgi:heptosyltransferase III
MSYGNYPDLKDVKKVLVVKLRHLGDVLLTSSVFTCLKKNMPHASIDAYIYEEASPLLEGNDDVADIITYDRKWKNLPFFKRMIQERSVIKKIRNKRYDLVINLTEGDRGALIAKLSKAPIKVGVDPGNSGFFCKRKIYSKIVKNCGSPKHTVEKNLDALRCIGIFPSEEEKELFLHIPKKDDDVVTQLLSLHGIEKDFILIHPASRWKFKCWPMSKFSDLIKILVERGEKVVITSGRDKDEMEMVDNIIRNSGEGNSILNLSGKITIKQLSSLINKSKVVVCSDSVSLHIASALKSKCVVLFGPTSEITWGPWHNDNAKVVYKKLSCRPCCMDGCGGSKRSECLHAIEVDDVVKSII